MRNKSLYLVISEEFGKGRSSIEIATAAIKGGVDIIQMREKNKAPDELRRLGASFVRLCQDSNVMFIVNDDPVLAKEVNADGVHLGQEDAVKYPVNKARKILGNRGIIGISTHSVEQFVQANIQDYDYIAFGPIFPTKTKNYSLGTKDIKEVVKISKKPVFFIGGINLSNIDIVLNEGAKNVALIRGITEAEDIAAATAEYKERLLRPFGPRNDKRSGSRNDIKVNS